MTDFERAAQPHPIQLAAKRAALGPWIWQRLRRRLRGMYWRRVFLKFGRGASLDRPLMLNGSRGISIGARVQIWPLARLEAFRIDAGVPRLVIEDETVIHPFVHIGAAESVRIGRGVLMASHVYITDHDHDWSDPRDPVISNGRLLVAPVVIGDYTWLGERVMVLKGVQIGERSIIGAGSIVTRDVPPYSVVAGVPARVLRRFDHATSRWVKVSGE